MTTLRPVRTFAARRNGHNTSNPPMIVLPRSGRVVLRRTAAMRCGAASMTRTPSSMRGSLRARCVDEAERPGTFERARGAQHPMVLPRRPDDLQTDRQAVRRKAARHAGGRLLGEIERIGI